MNSYTEYNYLYFIMYAMSFTSIISLNPNKKTLPWPKKKFLCIAKETLDKFLTWKTLHFVDKRIKVETFTSLCAEREGRDYSSTSEIHNALFPSTVFFPLILEQITLVHF